MQSVYSPWPLITGGAKVGIFGVGLGLGAGVISGASVCPGGRVWPGARVGFGLGVLLGSGAAVTDGAGVGMFLQTGTRQHGSLGSVSNVQPSGTTG